jgi:hypothetical protein
LPEHASSGYVLSNPLSGGELVLVGITGIVGYGLADFLGRYMETTAVASGQPMNSLPAGQAVGNDVATMAWPSWQSMAAQFGVAAVPGVASAFVDSPWGRAALQGMMLGAGFSLFGGLFKSLMAYMLSSNPLGQQLYLAEIEAQSAVTAAGGTAAVGAPATAAPAATAPAPVGTQGLPQGVGRPPMLRAPSGMGQAAAPVGAALATAPVGGPGRTPPSIAQPGGAPATPITQRGIPGQVPGILTNTGDVLPTPAPGAVVPGGASTGPSCAPCTSTSGGIAATDLAAIQAIRDESCLGKTPGGHTMYSVFPDE